MKAILNIEVKEIADEYPNLSFLGEYTDKYNYYNIVCETGKFICEGTQEDIPVRQDQYKYFKPYARGEKEGTKKYIEYGKQDFERMRRYNTGYWCMIGVKAIAKISINNTIQTIKSSGLWGIESDSDESYKTEIKNEQLNELKSTLIEIGFKPNEIENLKPVT